jgi:hypothetical protein
LPVALKSSRMTLKTSLQRRDCGRC